MKVWTHQWQEVAKIIGSPGDEMGVYPFLSSTDIIHELLGIAARYPNAMALWDDGKEMTYNELITAIQSFATCLHRNGVSDGERVVLFIPNSVGLVIGIFACFYLGAIAIPLNPVLGRQEREKILTDAMPRVVLTWFKDEHHRQAQMYLCTIDDVTVDSWNLQNSEVACGTPVPVQPNRIAIVMYTSGTTGVPKGVMLTNRNLLISTVSYQRIFHLSNKDRTLVAVPLFHVTGLVGQLLTILLVGGTVVLVSKFSATKYFDQLRTHKVSFIFAVPTILTLALYREGRRASETRALRVIASGGAPIAADLVERIFDVFPEASFYNTYGMTEVASPATILPAEVARDHVNSVGLPVPGLRLRVVGSETSRDLGPEQVGQLLMQGPMVTPGYWNNHCETERAFRDGWLYSGDLASIDVEGYVRIEGRIKEMINRGGEKIYPADVERLLLSHPAVMQAAVYGIPDEVWGERVYCAISFKPGMSVEIAELEAWLENRVARFKIPENFVVLPELPLNVNGKINKQLLRSLPLGK